MSSSLRTMVDEGSFGFTETDVTRADGGEETEVEGGTGW